jgi:Na+-transporting NADH:ubiquinone oxidoreductase subunit NqrC
MSLIARTILKQIEKQIRKSNELSESESIKFCLDYCSNRLFFEIKGRDMKGNETEIKSKVVPIEGEGAEKWSQISGFIGRLKELVSADELHFIDALIDTKEGGFDCEVYYIKDKEKKFKRTFLTI